MPESCEDWYEAIISAQPDGVGLDEKDRDKFNRAFESFTAGSYDSAYNGFVELSKGGSSISQYYLGLMYLGSMGVLQDFRQAHMWLNIAAGAHHPAVVHVDGVGGDAPVVGHEAIRCVDDVAPEMALQLPVENVLAARIGS